MMAGVWLSNMRTGPEAGDLAENPASDPKAPLGARILAHAPLTLVTIMFDAAFNGARKMQAPYTVGVADRYTWSDRKGGQHVEIAGNREVGESLVRYGISRGFDFAKAEEIDLHSAAFPIGHSLASESNVRVVPILINPWVAPERPLTRYRNLAAIIEEFLSLQRPALERHAVYAAGSTSRSSANGAGTPGETIGQAVERLTNLARSEDNAAILADAGFPDRADAAAAVVWFMAQTIGGHRPPAAVSEGTDGSGGLFAAIEIGQA